MTTQTPDCVFYKGRRYELLRDTSGMLPMLNELGIRPMYSSPAHQRGYEAEYEIDKEQLYLTNILVGTGDLTDRFPLIGNVSPIKESTVVGWEDGKYIWSDEVFYRLKHPMRISGTIAIKYWGIDDRQEIAEGMRAFFERIKLYGDNASPPEIKRLNPFPLETLKLKVVDGHIQAHQDVTEIYARLTQAKTDLWMDYCSLSGSKHTSEWIHDWDVSPDRHRLEKEIDNLLSEETE